MQNAQPPSKENLEIILSQAQANPFMREVAQKKINEFNLPYRIEINPDKSCKLCNLFTTGEEYLNRFITVNPAMIAMKQRAGRMALTDYPVLITGETGTGKELIAKSMIGNRSGFIQCVNCAGLPEELVESEIFGHSKGAFTGAVSDKTGLMESAKDGVCFMDEIGEIPMAAQGKLLRAIQDMTVRPVGSNKSVKINCKFVFATNRDIKEMYKAGQFRLDLYARISTLELHIIPLRERMQDCQPIIEAMQGGKGFMHKYGGKLMSGELDLSLNIRSLEQYVIRYNVLGEI
jgi:transcriptional regulator with PAS, ATPase and Fis domain